MKILFLCGSLEPGKDGVGDYARRMAGELMHQGNHTSIIALNDKYIELESIEQQQSEGIDLEVLRLPASRSQRERFSRAKQRIDEFDPDWLSLQFVIFAFHHKGLPVGIGKRLAELGKGRHWHIMFHELWVGMNVEASLKFLWWGKVQRMIIKNLIIKLPPSVIHTQTKLYQAQLIEMGYQAEYLPLFSNIPVFKKHNRILNTSDNYRQPENAVKFIVFGAIHPNAPVMQFAKEAVSYANMKRLDISLTMIGRNGNEQEYWVKVCHLAGLKIEVLGEQSAENIAEVLASSSIGISTTPLELLEKSGTVAAFREHGLPVICVTKPWYTKMAYGYKLLPGITQYHEGNLHLLLDCKADIHYNLNLSKISHSLISSLSDYT